MTVATDILAVQESCRDQPIPSAPGVACSVLEARSDWQLIDLREIWAFREVLYFLIWRDVKVRYKQTVLGAAWAILQPLAQMAVFSVVLGRLVEQSALGVPYPLFAFAGLLPWNFFSSAVTSAAGSMVGNQGLVTKVYFPRVFLPGSAVGVAAIDFTIAFGMLVVLMLYYNLGFSLSLLLIPGMVFGLAGIALGVGTLLSALTVAYRDLRYVVPFLMQLWLFATPAIYFDTRNIDARWQWALPLNPLHGLILNFRRVALGQEVDSYTLAFSLAITVLVLFFGFLYFRRVERTLADII